MRATLRRTIFSTLLLTSTLPHTEASIKPPAGETGINFRATFDLAAKWSKTFVLAEGQAFELSARLPVPSQLPQHGRVAVSWSLVEEKKASPHPAPVVSSSKPARKPDDFGIYTLPTAHWRKVLHALDPDIYLVYSAPVAGTYKLEISPLVDEPTVFEGPRWRETGTAPSIVRFPQSTPWSVGTKVSMALALTPLELGRGALPFHVETEPNDTPEQAQPIPLPSGEGVQTVLITGGADDIEYFDNGKVGQSGDDWFRLSYQGTEPRLLTCNLTIPDQTLAAQLRFYALDASPEEAQALLSAARGLSGRLLPLVEYTEGHNENERSPSAERTPSLRNQPHPETRGSLLPQGRSQCARL